MRAVSSEQALLEAARANDEGAFERLVTPYRGELHAHCYRMLGSVYDADDALQDALLRAWRSLGRFEGRSSLRSWLYRIATNTCLDLIGRRPKRVLPIDYGPPTDPHDGPGQPIVESVWVEPYPDEGLATSYEQREGIELAFIAALQLLPAKQRAALILREVLGFSAKEVAETLDTTVASVNSALQRARKTIDDELPDQSQQETLQSLGDDELREIVDRYVDAWERNDVEAVVSMLTEDATISMPPLASWFGGREDVTAFLAGYPLSGAWRWRAIPVRANAQPALAFYAWDEDERAYLPFALNVLSFRGDRVNAVTAFVVRATEIPADASYERWVDEPLDARRLAGTFEHFGVPSRLEE